MGTMSLDDDMPEGSKKNLRKPHSRATNTANVTNKKVSDAQNKNKFEMYWGKQVAHAAHSVPIVSHSPTLQDIPEESEIEHSEDETITSTSNSMSYHHNFRPKHRPAFTTQVVFESNLAAKDTSSTSLDKRHSASDDIRETEKSLEVMDQEFSDLMFLQLQTLRTTLLETKELKQGIEDRLDLIRKENEQLIKENDSLHEKIHNFQQQEDTMISDRRELTSQLVYAREQLGHFQQHQQQIPSKENNDQSQKLQEENVKLKSANELLKSKLENCQHTIKKLMVENSSLDREEEFQVLHEENFKLKSSNELMKTRLENCQHTIKKMMEENSSLKKEEEELKAHVETGENEIKRLSIDLAVWQQKVKKLEDSSATSSFISDQQIDISSNFLEDIQLITDSSYMEIVPSPPRTTPIGLRRDTAEKNKMITVIKGVSQSANSSANVSQMKLQNRNEAHRSPSQQATRGLASLLDPDPKDTVMRRIESKSIAARLSALEVKIQKLTVLEEKIHPIMNLIESSKKTQERTTKELEQKLNRNINAVHTQLASLQNTFEDFIKSQLSQSNNIKTPTIIPAAKPNRTYVSIGARRYEFNKTSPSSKSNIPISINRK